jgi:hypothetical protein
MPTIYKSLNQSSLGMVKNGKAVNPTYSEIFDYIREKNPNRANISRLHGHKNDDNKSHEFFQFGKNVKCNEYEFHKNSKYHSVSWALNMDMGQRRRKGKINNTNSQLSGVIYYDIDTFEGCTINQIRDLMSENPMILAHWVSVSGGGLGFLVKCEGLTFENFTYTYNYHKNRFENYFKENLNNIEPNVVNKDVGFFGGVVTIDTLSDYTRLNVLSYDPSLYVDEDALSVIALDPPKKKIQLHHNLNNIEEESPNEYYQLEGIVNTTKGQSNAYDGERYTYKFFFDYFARCNIFGINKENAIAFLSKKHEEVYSWKYGYDSSVGFADHAYVKYECNFNSFLNGYEVNDNYELINYNILFSESHDENMIKIKKNYFDVRFYNKELNVNFASKWAYKCKSDGILFRHLKEYINKNKKFIKVDEDFETKLISIYQDNWILFGAQLKLKDHIIKKKITDILNDSYEEMKSNISFLKDVRFKNLKDDYKNHQMMYAITFDFIENGFQLEDTLDELNKLNINDSFNPNFIKVYVSEIYNKFSYKIGYRKITRLNEKELMPFNLLSTHVIPKGKYMSDIDFSTDLTYYCNWGYTGIGKTHQMVNTVGVKMIIVVPTTNLIESLSYKYPELNVYYGEKKNITEKTEKVIVTYSSIKPLIIEMEKMGHKIKEFECHFDEGHNFTMTKKQFRNKELNYLLEISNSFKKFILYTGTKTYDSHPLLTNIPVFKFVPEVIPIKKFKEVRFKNMNKSIINRIKKGELNVILLQNKQYESKLGDILKLLEMSGQDMKKVWCINSDEKNNEPYQYLIKNEAIRDDIEVLITTSLIIEGTNITNTNCATMHFASFVCSELMEQFANRFRVKKPKMIYYYKSIDYDNQMEGDFDIKTLNDELTKKFEGLTEFLDSSLDQIKSFSAKTASNVFFTQMLDNNHFRKLKNNTYEVDYLSVSSEALTIGEGYEFANVDYLQKKLKPYNWQFDGIENDGAVDITKVDRDILKINRNMKKDEKIALYNNFYCKIKDLDYGEVSAILDKNKLTNGVIYNDLLIKYLKIGNYITSKSLNTTIYNWINVDQLSESKFKITYERIKLHYAIENYDMDIAKLVHPFSKAMVNFYFRKKAQTNHNNQFTQHTLNQAFKAIFKNSKKIHKDSLKKIETVLHGLNNTINYIVGKRNEDGSTYCEISPKHNVNIDEVLEKLKMTFIIDKIDNGGLSENMYLFKYKKDFFSRDINYTDEQILTIYKYYMNFDIVGVNSKNAKIYALRGLNHQNEFINYCNDVKNIIRQMTTNKVEVKKDWFYKNIVKIRENMPILRQKQFQDNLSVNKALNFFRNFVEIEQIGRGKMAKYKMKGTDLKMITDLEWKIEKVVDFA